ncbi:MAG: dihydroorotate dehydrogenase electron transfer subunit [Candidatus Tantalella remota]|nr:dihydroorotate dehydrogenase electron transfer subunit [Candidatus Tantalella remota]
MTRDSRNAKIRKELKKAQIVSNVQFCSDHFLMKLKMSGLPKRAVPGQFVNVKVTDQGTDPLLRIPLGIHTATLETISLLYKTVGEGTEILSSKRKGESVDILGPLGNGFDISRAKGKKVFVVAGGHGTAPMYWLVEKLIRQGHNEVECFLGASSKNHILCKEEMEKLGAKVHVATEDGSLGFKGYVTKLVDERIDEISASGENGLIFGCGPKPMLEALAKDARMIGMPAQVSLDAYMACGIGACRGCAVKTKNGYKLVCSDGPVFDAQEIDWKA